MEPNSDLLLVGHPRRVSWPRKSNLQSHPAKGWHGMMDRFWITGKRAIFTRSVFLFRICDVLRPRESPWGPFEDFGSASGWSTLFSYLPVCLFKLYYFIIKIYTFFKTVFSPVQYADPHQWLSTGPRRDFQGPGPLFSGAPPVFLVLVTVVRVHIHWPGYYGFFTEFLQRISTGGVCRFAMGPWRRPPATCTTKPARNVVASWHPSATSICASSPCPSGKRSLFNVFHEFYRGSLGLSLDSPIFQVSQNFHASFCPVLPSYRVGSSWTEFS